ncbi:MAG: efflux RND transporter permease subunit, partial [Nitrospinota bacterium]
AIVALASDLDEDRLKVIAEDLAEEFETIKDVAKAVIRGDRKREVWVEADPRRLKAYGLSLGELISLLKNRNRNVTGGDVELGQEEVTIRSLGKFQRVEDIGGMVLKRNARGGVVYLGDVARVRMTHEDPKLKVTLDGKPAFLLYVLRKKKGNEIRIVEEVREHLREFQARFGREISSSIIFDMSLEIKKRIFTLQRNALIGMGLVLLILYLFLGLRNALFAFIGIPITLLITFIGFWWLGITVNGISLFAVILMLGIIVDDAIIVLENAVRHAEEGIPPAQAALRGAREVTLPVMASMLTTVAAFAPLFLVVGIMGRFIEQIPTVVIIILAASLFECFFMLPSHFAEYGRARADRRERPFFLPFLKRLHRRILKAALRHRALTVLITVLSLVGALAIVPKVEMFPNLDTFPRFDVKLWMPAGTGIEETHRVLQQVREIALRLPRGEVKSVVTQAGMLEENYAEIRGDNLGTVTVLLKERGERRFETAELIEHLRPMVLREVVGARTIKFERILEGPPEGPPVEIAVKGRDYAVLKTIAGRIEEELQKIPGVVDIDDDYRLGKREFTVRVDEAKSRLWGITAGEVADTIRAAFEGTEATKFHEQDEEIDVLVKLLPQYRKSLDDIGSLTLIGEGGRAIPLKEVATFELVRGIDRIRRVDGKRAVRVTAELTGGATSKAVNDRIRRKAPLILAPYPGYTLSF